MSKFEGYLQPRQNEFRPRSTKSRSRSAEVAPNQQGASPPLRESECPPSQNCTPAFWAGRGGGGEGGLHYEDESVAGAARRFLRA